MSRAWNVEMAALGRWGLSPCSPRIGSFRSFEGSSQGSCTISVLQTIFLICLDFGLNLQKPGEDGYKKNLWYSTYVRVQRQ